MRRNRSSSSISQKRVTLNSPFDVQWNASFDPSRPPGGSHSPMAVQGRSVRELEEQMSTLRKENFNLKLRIYFMEEGQPGARSNHNGESASKQLIESKIEVEVLRKTVEEKTELLKDAARAISHHEEIQRKADMESQAMIDHLQEQIRGYQAASRAGNPSAVIDAEKLRRLEQEIQRLENELLEGDMRHTAAKSQLEFALAERLDSLMACEAKIEELAIKNAELVERLQKDTESSEAANETIVKLRAELGGCHDENGRLTNAVSAAETELKRQNNSIREATDTLDVQRKAIQLMEGNIKHKDANYSRLLGSVLDYEALIAKQTTEMDSLRQEIQYYRDLTENLQQKVQMQRLERVAIVQPMRTVADAGVGIERSGSSTSLNSNFSSLSVLCGRRGPVRESLCQWSAAQQQQQQRQTHQQQPQPLQQLPVNRQPTHLPTSIHSSRRQRYPGGHAALLTVAAPSTAFYNYSLPSLTGFRQFLWRWGTSPSN
ncbi:centrosomin isoform X11 [Drosophila ananassae]|uniref:centrosomin isoform X11 n=1 Tax=Drosophila ananassae TaxID=7217 RepID=UPI001CFF9DDE|nr:centrosomin isoform X11 [Drosophila ananassae]